VIGLGSGSAQFGVQAQEENAQYSPQRSMATRAEPAIQRASERASRQSDVVAFRTPKGRILYTNDREKFLKRRGYTEVDPYSAKASSRPERTTYQYRNAGKIRTVSNVRGIPEDIKRHVEFYARQNNLDESLVYAVIKAESSFNSSAKSSKGAQGLMQLMPATAKQMGVRDPYDVGENIRGGTRYLAKLLERFDGDLQLALAGYNAGPEKVKEYGGIPPYKETQDFVRKVIESRNSYYDTRDAADIRLASRERAATAIDRGQDRRTAYLVQFTSGHTQQAQNVIESGDDYIIQYQGKSYQVSKSLIRSVKPS
jgi:soluble lytic murein transglycosylase-like protein